jgi:MYXO-CTERM domain-containing protein
MIRFLFRSIGFLSLAAAFLMVVYDGMKSIVDSRITITSVRGLWELINAASLANLRPVIEGRLGPTAWDPVFTSFLNAPSWAVLGILGIVLILLGRRRRPLIGYAR